MRRNRHRRLREKPSQGLSHRSRLRQLVIESLEDRRVLSTSPFPELPGMELVDPHPGQFDGQIIYLDFDGADNVTYDGPVVVEGIDVPAFEAAAEPAGAEADIMSEVVRRLEELFANTGLQITIEEPDVGCVYSTVYVGGSGVEFGENGRVFLGVAEDADIGNHNRNDSAFVFSNLVLAVGSRESLVSVIAHETGHLLGYTHGESFDLSTEPENVNGNGFHNLESVAYAPSMHYYIARESLQLYRDLYGVKDEPLEVETYRWWHQTIGDWDSDEDNGFYLEEGLYDEDQGTLVTIDFAPLPYTYEVPLRPLNHFCDGGDETLFEDELSDGLLLGGFRFNTPYDNAKSDRYVEASRRHVNSQYYWLGRTMHLLQDSTVPAHVHKDDHFLIDDADDYEKYVSFFKEYFSYREKTDWDWDPSQASDDLTRSYFRGAKMDASTFVDLAKFEDRIDRYVSQISSEKSLEVLFRETTNYTEKYDSNDRQGDHSDSNSHYVFDAKTVGRAEWHKPEQVDNANGFNGDELRILSTDLGSWAIEQSAMLMRFYFADMHWVLDPPSNVSARTQGVPTTQITLSGDQVANDRGENADGYAIYRSTTLGSGWDYRTTVPKPSNPENQWTWTDREGLAPNTTYYYRIYSYTKQAGLGEYIDVFVETTSSTSPPRLGWGTYLGSASSDHAFPIATDSSGNIFVTGYTFSPTWTSGGLGSGGNRDAFVAKVSADGTRLLWARRIGGNSEEYGRGITVDSDGSAYVVGTTRSTNWLTNEMDLIGRQSGDGFVIKLNADGQVQWSKCIDGGANDDLYGIALTPDGDLLVTGTTTSSGLGYHGGGDVLVAKIRETSSISAKTLWQRKLGGSNLDVGRAVKVGSDGAVYITGYTQSSDWTSTLPGATLHGGEDAFVARLDRTGQQVTWVQFVGGTSTDSAFNLAVDKQGSVFIAGWTFSTGWTQGTHSEKYHGGEDAFVAKLYSTGTIAWSTCLGGTNRDYAVDIVVDGTGNAYVAGTTTSAGWVSRGPDTTLNGEDMFVAKMSNDGRTLWSTYLGGSGSDAAYGIALDGRGSAFVAGGTQSSNWNAYNWASTGYLTTRPGGEDAYIVKLLDAEVTSLRTRTSCPVDIEITDPTGRVMSKTLRDIPGATYVEADLDGDGDLNDEIVIPEPLTGKYTVRVIPEPGADPQATVTLVVQDSGVSTVLLDEVLVSAIPEDAIDWSVDRVPPVLTISPPPVLLPGGTWVPLTLDIQAHDNSAEQPLVSLISVLPSWDVDAASIVRSADFGRDDRSIELLAARGQEERYYSLVYSATDSNGNTSYATQEVFIGNSTPVVDAGPDWSANEGVIVSFDGTGSSDADNDELTYNWDFGDGSTGTGAQVTHVYADQGNYLVSLSVSDGYFGGAATDSVSVTIINAAPNAVNDSYELLEDGYLQISAPGILSNDVDVPADPLLCAVVDAPEHGSLQLDPNGAFLYTPDADFHGEDHFVYAVNDGDGGTAESVVTLVVGSVNDLPTIDIISDVEILEDDLGVLVSLTGLSPGRYDTESFRISASSGDLGIIPSLTVSHEALNDQGSLRFSPTPNAHGTAEITVIVEDSGADGLFESVEDNLSVTKKFRVTVLPVQDAPAAVSDAYSTNEGELLTISGPGILSNDSDVDGDEIQAVLVAATQYGSLQLSPDGSFMYVPKTQFNREDTFTYVASDSTNSSPPVSVTIVVTTAFPWHNGIEPVNVNDDKYVTPSDALMVINDLNRNGARNLPADRPRPLTSPFFDVSRDGRVSPIDALTVINYLNRRGQSEGEGGSFTDEIATSERVQKLVFGLPETSANMTYLKNGLPTIQEAGSHPSESRFLQSIDLLFARLDNTHTNGSRDKSTIRHGTDMDDLERFLNRMCGAEPGEDQLIGNDGRCSD